MPTTVRAVSDISPPVAGRTNGYADRGIENDAPGSRMTYSRLIGALFLVGFLFYGVGAALVTSVTGASDFLSTISAHQTTLIIGAFLMLLNTVVDVGKGVLFFPILENHGKRKRAGIPRLDYCPGGHAGRRRARADVDRPSE